MAYIGRAVGKQWAAGSDGDDGATGSTGATGAAGADGDDGATGATGSTGATGATGAAGAAGAAGANGIVNIAQAYTTSAGSYSDDAWRDISGLTVSITPTSTSSKILVSFTVAVGGYFAYAAARVVRDSTTLPVSSESDNGVGGMTGCSQPGNVRATAGMSFTYLDSPSTTSSVTYKLQVYAKNDFFINRPYATNTYAHPGMSNIIIQEIVT